MRKILLLIAMLAGPLLNKAIGEPYKSKIETAMREQISTLGQGNSFAYVDLGLTSEELYLLEQLKFDKLAPQTTVQYNRFGNIHLLRDELPAFISNMGNDDEEVIQAVTEIISKTVYQVTRASNKNSAWVCVRASTITNKFDMPRWHMDGAYFGLDGPFPYPRIVFKFAAVLKGAPTLLYNLTDDMRNIFNSNWNNRIFLSELLDLDKAESPKKGDGVFFIVADNKTAAIHSEPKIHENRLFFSILVGDESEIDELYLRWHA